MRYFVYEVLNDDKRVLAFINDVEKFARDVYKPGLMEFTGVSIEAESLEDAAVAYNHPSKRADAGEFFWCVEPPCTKKLDILNDGEIRLVQKSVDMVLNSPGMSALLSVLKQIDTVIGYFADRIHSNCPVVDTTEAYKLLKKRIVKEFQGYNYNDGDTEKTG